MKTEPFTFQAEPTPPQYRPSPESEDLDSAHDTAPFDSAQFLAWFMLKAAMGKPYEVRSSGFYIVQAPNDDWCVPLGKAVRDVYLGGKPGGRKRRMIGSGRPNLHPIELSSKADPRQAKTVTDEVHSVLMNNETAIVIAGSPTVIPAALRQASDGIFVTVSPVDSASLRDVGVNLCRI